MLQPSARSRTAEKGINGILFLCIPVDIWGRRRCHYFQRACSNCLPLASTADDCSHHVYQVICSTARRVSVLGEGELRPARGGAPPAFSCIEKRPRFSRSVAKLQSLERQRTQPMPRAERDTTQRSSLADEMQRRWLKRRPTEGKC